ncbi:MAG: phage tail protein [Nitrosomonadaceae bacterium]|nr:phage tail protein [Nitrosomonadaceae bacterium]
MAVRKDPYRNFNFLVEIDGIGRASFSECSGLVEGGDLPPRDESDDLHREGNMRPATAADEIAPLHELQANPTDLTEHHRKEKNTAAHKMPSQTRHTSIVLKRGLTNSRELYNWYNDVIKGKVRRAHGSIAVYDIDGLTVKLRWKFSNAYPIKWVGPALSGKGGDVVIETLELVHEGIEPA